jgi:hypothetical protein
MEQKVITNESLQSLEVYFLTPNGTKCYWLQPHSTIVIPAHFISENILNLQKRRMISVTTYR